MNVKKITVGNTYSVLNPTKKYVSDFLKKHIQKSDLEKMPEADVFFGESVFEKMQKQQEDLSLKSLVKLSRDMYSRIMDLNI